MLLDDRRLKGAVAENRFLHYCFRRGLEVCKPVLDGLPYDFIVKHNRVYKRVQVKYRSSQNGRISCISKLKQQNGRTIKQDYMDDLIDLLVIYCPETDRLYNIPFAVFDQNDSIVLRIEATKNGQEVGVRDASDYLLTI